MHTVASLQCGNYAAAWEAAITNRVDLNCLVDFAWPSFLSGQQALIFHLLLQSVLLRLSELYVHRASSLKCL